MMKDTATERTYLGNSMEKALKIAVDYTVETIRISAQDPDCPSYGVRFESALPRLIESLKN